MRARSRCRAGGSSRPIPIAVFAALREAEEEIGLPPRPCRGDRPARHLHHRHRLRDHAGRRPGARAVRAAARHASRWPKLFEVPLAFIVDPANHERHTARAARAACAASSSCPMRTATSGAPPRRCWSISPRCWRLEEERADDAGLPHHRPAAAAADRALSAVGGERGPGRAGGGRSLARPALGSGWSSPAWSSPGPCCSRWSRSAAAATGPTCRRMSTAAASCPAMSSRRPCRSDGTRSRHPCRAIAPCRGWKRRRPARCWRRWATAMRASSAARCATRCSGAPSADIDIATPLVPDEVVRRLGRCRHQGGADRDRRTAR